MHRAYFVASDTLPPERSPSAPTRPGRPTCCFEHRRNRVSHWPESATTRGVSSKKASCKFVRMSDLVASVFQFSNVRYRPVPAVDFGYKEKASPVEWRVYAGGSRGYALRFGPGVAKAAEANLEAQNADSHFMMQRVECALLLAGHGLFKSTAVGRMLFRSIQEWPDWTMQYDFPAGLKIEASAEFNDWFAAMTKHTILKRAAADAHAALSNTHEAHVFVYRGLEWLVSGESRSWEQLSADIGVSHTEIRAWKRLINKDHAGRHASRSGTKLRADAMDAVQMVAGLFDAIHATRSRLDADFKPSPPEVIAKALMEAVPREPYA